MEQVFVTGASGLLGTNLIIELLNRGFYVKALLRSKKKFIDFSDARLHLVEGDLSDLQLLNKEIAGCSKVVHAAANTNQSLLSSSDYFQPNVKGTENIISACQKNQVEKLIYVGTANTFGYGSLKDLGNEDKKMKYPFTKSFYALSKNKAQGIIDNASGGLNITTISPTFMIGPYDVKPSSGKLIIAALDKKIVFYPSGGKNFVHVKDVVQAVINGFDIRESGSKFIIANENLSYKTFFSKVISLNNQNTRLIKMPDSVLKSIGLLGDLARTLNIRTSASTINTKVLSINNFYSNNKANEELGIAFTPIDSAIEEAVKYLKGKKLNKELHYNDRIND